MRKFTLMYLAVLCLVIPTYGQQPTSKPKASEASASYPPQRYQLITAEIEWSTHQEGRSPALFLLDTQTGRVWRYQAPSSSEVEGKTEHFPEVFIPVEIWKTLDKPKTLPQE